MKRCSSVATVEAFLASAASDSKPRDVLACTSCTPSPNCLLQMNLFSTEQLCGNRTYFAPQAEGAKGLHLAQISGLVAC